MPATFLTSVLKTLRSVSAGIPRLSKGRNRVISGRQRGPLPRTTGPRPEPGPSRATGEHRPCRRPFPRLRPGHFLPLSVKSCWGGAWESLDFPSPGREVCPLLDFSLQELRLHVHRKSTRALDASLGFPFLSDVDLSPVRVHSRDRTFDAVLLLLGFAPKAVFLLVILSSAANSGHTCCCPAGLFNFFLLRHSFRFRSSRPASCWAHRTVHLPGPGAVLPDVPSLLVTWSFTLLCLALPSLWPLWR